MTIFEYVINVVILTILRVMIKRRVIQITQPRDSTR